MGKSILLFVLVCMALLVIGTIVIYVYQLVVPYNESKIIINYRNMKQNTIRFNHNDVFKKTCEAGVSYVFWCHIENFKTKYDRLKPILTKGPEMVKSSNIEMLQTNKSMPGIFLGNNSMNETGSDPNEISKEPTLYFTFRETTKTDSEYNDIYELTNIPLNKWFHIAVSIRPNNVELYMDGVLLKTINFVNELDFNFGKLNIGELDGFDGSISKLAALPYAMSATEVYRRFFSGYDVKEGEEEEICIPPEEKEEIEVNPENNDLWDSIPYDLTQESVNSPDIVLDGTDVVTIFSQPNFGGSSATLSVGNYSVSDLAVLGIKPGTISGVLFNRDDFLLTLYVADEPTPTDRKVDYLTLRDDSDWNGPLRRMNNKARSLKIEHDPNKDNLKVILYEGRGYRGHKLRLPIGKFTETDLRMYGYDSYFKFNSYIIDPDYQLRVYRSDFFKNEKNIFRDSNPKVGVIDIVSSLKVEPRSDDEVATCTFYEGKNFTSNSYKLSYGEYNMEKLIKKGIRYDNLNSMFLLRSVVIPKGYNVLLYPNDEFQGIPQRLDTSTRYIQGKLIHLTIIKSLKIVSADEPRFSLRKILYKLESMIMGYDEKNNNIE
jgi:hypothetical protein